MARERAGELPILHIRVQPGTREQLTELGEHLGGTMSQAARYLIERGLAMERERQDRWPTFTRPGNHSCECE